MKTIELIMLKWTPTSYTVGFRLRITWHRYYANYNYMEKSLSPYLICTHWANDLQQNQEFRLLNYRIYK